MQTQEEFSRTGQDSTPLQTRAASTSRKSQEQTTLSSLQYVHGRRTEAPD
jgi:hypothetical protein